MRSMTDAVGIFIQKECDIKEMCKKVKLILKLGESLKAAELFRERAVQYAQLEAEALLRVVDLGGVKKLKKDLQAVAEWLHRMGDAQRNHYIRMCAEGLTIDQVYKREVGDKITLEENIRLADRLRAGLVEELNATGKTDMTAFNEKCFKMFNAKLANDIIDGARNTLLMAGGISPGEGSRVYFKVTSDGNEEGIKDAVRLRVNKLSENFNSIIEILDKSGVKMQYEEVLGELGEYRTEWAFVKNPFRLHVLLALSEYGAFSNSEKIYELITEHGGMNLYRLFDDYPSFARFIDEAYSALSDLRATGKIA